MGQNQATFFKSREQIVVHPGEQTFLNNMHVLMSTEVKVDYDNALK